MLCGIIRFKGQGAPTWPITLALIRNMSEPINNLTHLSVSVEELSGGAPILR